LTLCLSPLRRRVNSPRSHPRRLSSPATICVLALRCFQNVCSRNGWLRPGPPPPEAVLAERPRCPNTSRAELPGNPPIPPASAWTPSGGPIPSDPVRCLWGCVSPPAADPPAARADAPWALSKASISPDTGSGYESWSKLPHSIRCRQGFRRR
jgi:hypothetical protein